MITKWHEKQIDSFEKLLLTSKTLYLIGQKFNFTKYKNEVIVIACNLQDSQPLHWI